MIFQEQDAFSSKTLAMDSPSEQPIAKQLWHRPAVTFVPIKVTAGSTKNTTSSDNYITGTFGP